MNGKVTNFKSQKRDAYKNKKKITILLSTRENRLIQIIIENNFYNKLILCINFSFFILV